MQTTVWKAEKSSTPAAKRKHAKKEAKAETAQASAAETSKGAPNEPGQVAWIKVSTSVGLPPVTQWLRVTSVKTGYEVYVPLPIRLIQVIPTKDGNGGCLVRGAHGDEVTAKEGIVEILGRLNGIALGGASEWALAG